LWCGALVKGKGASKPRQLGQLLKEDREPPPKGVDEATKYRQASGGPEAEEDTSGGKQERPLVRATKDTWWRIWGRRMGLWKEGGAGGGIL